MNFDHVQKILHAKRLQRQAKTGNNVIKRRPGRPRKQPVEESKPANVWAENWADGRGLDTMANRRTLGMPILERCDNLSAIQSLRPSLTLETQEHSGHDSISAAIENVVHQARSVPPLAKEAKRRSRGHSRDELWSPTSQ